MSRFFRNIVVGTATVLMASVGFLLSVAATILSVYIPSRGEIPIPRLKSRRTAADHSTQTTSTTPTTSTRPPTPVISDVQLSAQRSTPLRSRTCDPSHCLVTSFEAHSEPPFVVSQSLSSKPPYSISNKDQNPGVLFERPATSPRTHSFHISPLKCCPHKKRRTSRSISPSRTAFNGLHPPQPLLTTTTSKQINLKKAPSVPIMAHGAKSMARKTPPRTRPYEAPYFFPKPGSPEAADYGYTPLRRAATAHDSLADKMLKPPTRSNGVRQAAVRVCSF